LLHETLRFVERLFGSGFVSVYLPQRNVEMGSEFPVKIWQLNKYGSAFSNSFCWTNISPARRLASGSSGASVRRDSSSWIDSCNFSSVNKTIARLRRAGRFFGSSARPFYIPLQLIPVVVRFGHAIHVFEIEVAIKLQIAYVLVSDGNDSFGQKWRGKVSSSESLAPYAMG